MIKQWPKWHFRPIHQKSEKNTDPGEDLFFQEIGPVVALVRESIQNSLDAKINPESNDEPVVFRISLNGKGGPMGPEKYTQYIQDLPAHLATKEETKQKLPDLEKPMNYLVIEDFGTKGLTGDTHIFSHDDDTKEVQNNNFYWFHRNVNRTPSRHKRGGSFGYGKQAFASASNLNAFFTVSSTPSKEWRMFGTCVFKGHFLENQRYAAYADWGIEGELDHRLDHAIVPNETEELALKMIQDFDLDRNQGPGLSVVVPFPVRELTPEEIAMSVIRNYFVPVCRGELEVQICENGEKIFHLSKDTILSCAEQIDWEGAIPGTFSSAKKEQMTGLISLVLWWTNEGQGSEIELLEPSASREPHWSKDLIPHAELDQIRKNLENGGRIALKSKLEVKKNRLREGEITEFYILIHKDESYTDSENTVWIRRFLDVPKIQYHVPVGYIAAIISLDGELEELLRDSEEPAHIKHRDQGTKAHEKWGYARGIIRFFRRSGQDIIRHLEHKENQLVENWIDEWFSLPDESKGTSRKKKRKAKKESKEEAEVLYFEDDPPPVDLEKPELFHDISYIPGGFEISGSLDLAAEFSFSVKLGYSRDDGKDPFKKWKPFDFVIGEAGIIVESSGINNLLPEGNLIRFSVSGPTENFSIRVTGFDIDRDLSINYRPRIIQNEGADQ